MAGSPAEIGFVSFFPDVPHGASPADPLPCTSLMRVARRLAGTSMEDGILCVVSLIYSFVPARDRAACEAAAERGPAPAGRRRAVACLHNMRTLAGAAWLAFLAALRAQAGVDWKPVNAEELCLKSPRVDKDAAAEIIFK